MKKNTKTNQIENLLKISKMNTYNQDIKLEMPFKKEIIKLKSIQNKIDKDEFYVHFEKGVIQIYQTDLITVFSSGHFLSVYPHLEIDDFFWKSFHPTEIQTQQWKDQFEKLPKVHRFSLINSIILSQKPSKAFHFFHKIKFLDAIFPELAATVGIKQNRFHIHDVFNHLLASIDAVENPDLVLRWAALLHDIGKTRTQRLKEDGEYSFYNHEIESARMTPQIMKRFGIDKETGLKIKFLVRNHMFHYTDEWTDRAIRRFMKKIPRDAMKDLILLRLADRKGSGRKDYFPPAIHRLLFHIDKVQEKDSAFKVTDLEINGHNLMELGIAAGPKMGKLLNHLKLLVEKKKLENEKSILLDYVVKFTKSEKTH